jgi:hypothetical protein
VASATQKALWRAGIKTRSRNTRRDGGAQVVDLIENFAVLAAIAHLFDQNPIKKLHAQCGT